MLPRHYRWNAPSRTPKVPDFRPTPHMRADLLSPCNSRPPLPTIRECIESTTALGKPAYVVVDESSIFTMTTYDLPRCTMRSTRSTRISIPPESSETTSLAEITASNLGSRLFRAMPDRWGQRIDFRILSRLRRERETGRDGANPRNSHELTMWAALNPGCRGPMNGRRSP